MFNLALQISQFSTSPKTRRTYTFLVGLRLKNQYRRYCSILARGCSAERFNLTASTQQRRVTSAPVLPWPMHEVARTSLLTPRCSVTQHCRGGGRRGAEVKVRVGGCQARSAVVHVPFHNVPCRSSGEVCDVREATRPSCYSHRLTHEAFVSCQVLFCTPIAINERQTYSDTTVYWSYKTKIIQFNLLTDSKLIKSQYCQNLYRKGLILQILSWNPLKFYFKKN